MKKVVGKELETEIAQLKAENEMLRIENKRLAGKERLANELELIKQQKEQTMARLNFQVGAEQMLIKLIKGAETDASKDSDKPK